MGGDTPNSFYFSLHLALRLHHLLSLALYAFSPSSLTHILTQTLIMLLPRLLLCFRPPAPALLPHSALPLLFPVAFTPLCFIFLFSLFIFLYILEVMMEGVGGEELLLLKLISSGEISAVHTLTDKQKLHANTPHQNQLNQLLLACGNHLKAH